VQLAYRYGAHPSQYAELALPPSEDGVPVVVVVHGGFWRTGYGSRPVPRGRARTLRRGPARCLAGGA